MSMPVFPNTTITRENAINQILSSIAMEELSLSHILNAEGEKIQHILGTLTGQTVSGAGIQDLLSIDESVMAMMESVRNTQSILLRKMETALGTEPEPAPKPEPKPEPKQ